MRTWVLLALVIGVCTLAADRPASVPRYTARGELVRPEGYREWVFVGSGLGMSYNEGSAYDASPEFANIYLRPESYRAFCATGKFPDHTMLVMERTTSGGQASINRHGRFEDRILGIEVALKDEERFPEKWAYFSFIGPGGKPLDQAKAFPQSSCWSCHHAHGAVDNVFAQFYPVLRAARPDAFVHTLVGDAAR